MTTAYPTIRAASVIGAGAWGTTLARHLANQGLTVTLWTYEPDVVDQINLTRENARFLPGVTLPARISATHSLREAVTHPDLLVLAVPSHAMRTVIRQLQPALARPVPVVVASKGIEEHSLLLMSQILTELLPAAWSPGVAVLTGPSFAAETCRDKPTTVLLAGRDARLMAHLQTVFMAASFRVYIGTDLIGAQLGGALKNVMAIAAGVVDGLELGLNARAALITRGLAEVIRLGVALGADVHTFYGLSGLGDLILTGTGSLSRNHAVGVQVATGRRLESLLKETVTVAEGVRTTKAALALAQRCQVDMPIVQCVHAVLFEGKPPTHVVADLMARSAKEETPYAMPAPAGPWPPPPHPGPLPEGEGEAAGVRQGLPLAPPPLTRTLDSSVRWNDGGGDVDQGHDGGGGLTKERSVRPGGAPGDQGSGQTR